MTTTTNTVNLSVSATTTTKTVNLSVSVVLIQLFLNALFPAGCPKIQAGNNLPARKLFLNSDSFTENLTEKLLKIAKFRYMYFRYFFGHFREATTLLRVQCNFPMTRSVRRSVGRFVGRSFIISGKRREITLPWSYRRTCFRPDFKQPSDFCSRYQQSHEENL